MGLEHPDFIRVSHKIKIFNYNRTIFNIGGTSLLSSLKIIKIYEIKGLIIKGKINYCRIVNPLIKHFSQNIIRWKLIRNRKC